MRYIKEKNNPYIMMLAVYLVFIAAAFIQSSPQEIFDGLKKILMSRSLLLTDYIYVGGIGATLINSAIVGSISIAMLVVGRVKPSGAVIAALWLTTGFAMFGKNLFNMLPITFGVYLFSVVKKEPFSKYEMPAMLSATLSPVVSGIAFYGINPYAALLLAILCGMSVGFIFPAVSAFTGKILHGFNLYNMGFAGGLISTFLVAALSAVGINMETCSFWSTGNNFSLAVLLYIIFAIFIVSGIIAGDGLSVVWEYPAKVLSRTGRAGSDYYKDNGNKVYFNMGLTGAAATTLMIILGCDLNGPTLAGIFTIVGFSAYGKHIGNITPLFIGAVISTRVNLWHPSDPINTLAILFSTGLAPIAGTYGWFWGIAAGFLHVNTVLHIGFLNTGLNLYNNGFAAGFVVMMVLPLAITFSKRKIKDADSKTELAVGKK